MAFNTFDPYDLVTLQNLIAAQKDGASLYSGINVHGVKCTIAVFPDKVVVKTPLRIGVTKTVTYWPDGTQEESINEQLKRRVWQ